MEDVPVHYICVLDDESAPAIKVETDPDYRDANVVIQGLIDFNATHAAGLAPRELLVTLRDAEGKVVGGLSGDTWTGWLQVHALWVADGLRGKGHGGKLLQTAEREAVRRGCTRAYLETLEFQAPAFYQKLGYAIFSRLDGFPPGGARYVLVKTL
ncbi:GNAT family N-acetyltransferase [Janthinobacterium lividum]|uniref:GNAT family N-acetyltransferase n=1 Tax=Janthinobacterium lividum TaxID=29581 RepID=UPI00068FA269|nr:GNAT family N-acetyltransferase [Janthinobacterium lividum]